MAIYRMQIMQVMKHNSVTAEAVGTCEGHTIVCTCEGTMQATANGVGIKTMQVTITFGIKTDHLLIVVCHHPCM